MGVVAETNTKTETDAVESGRTTRMKDPKGVETILANKIEKEETSKEEISVESEKRRQAKVIAMEVKKSEMVTEMKKATGMVENARTTRSTVVAETNTKTETD